MHPFSLSRSRRVGVVTLAAVAFVTLGSIAHAQQAELTVTSNAGSVFHRLSEAYRNGLPLTLRPSAKRANAFTAHQSLDQQSDVFAVRPGDTIALYRELRWLGITEVDGAASGDTVDVSIDMIDATTRRRVALIDSVGVLLGAGGRNMIFGTQPPFALLRYVVDRSLGASRVVLRRRCFVRSAYPSSIDASTEHVDVPPSRALADPHVEGLRRRYGGILEFREPAILDAACNGRSALAIETMLDDGRLRVMFQNAPVEGVTSIMTYGADGVRRFINLIAEHSPGGREVLVLRPAPGDHYVALFHDNLLVSALVLPQTDS